MHRNRLVFGEVGCSMFAGPVEVAAEVSVCDIGDCQLLVKVRLCILGRILTTVRVFFKVFDIDDLRWPRGGSGG